MAPRTINRLSVLLLAVGFGAALTVYIFTEADTTDSFTTQLLGTKRYQHDLRLMGGRASVVFVELQEWFLSLWHGRQLATTLAVLTVVVVPVFRFFARHPELLSGADEPLTVPARPKPPGPHAGSS